MKRAIINEAALLGRRKIWPEIPIKNPLPKGWIRLALGSLANENLYAVQRNGQKMVIRKFSTPKTTFALRGGVPYPNTLLHLKS